jgi:chromosomal replication initiator protein
MQRPVSPTFATFVAAPENRSALLAVQEVAECLRANRSAVAPLFLHGPTGTGKSHLLAALLEQASRQTPPLALTVVTAGDGETFADGMPGESCDLLVVEDVQHLPARQAPAMTAALDALAARQVPVVLTATVGPRQLSLPERLLSRLAGGLVVGLEPLSAASRLQVLNDKAQRRQLAVHPNVLAWLAEHFHSIRQLEGALTRLEVLVRGRPLDMAAVAEHIRADVEASRPTVERIAERVSRQFHVEVRHLRSERRGRQVMLPRQVGMYLARRLTGLSLEQIGAYFGGRDHSTVLHACRKVERVLSHDAALSGTVRQLYAELA